MLVKNIFTAFAIAGMAAAYPTEDYEYEARGLEERLNSPTCSQGHNWCCQNEVPFSILFFSGAGNNCFSSQSCPKGTSSLCCPNGQIVSNGKNSADVVCLK